MVVKSANTLGSDEIVISGISGAFPNSENIAEFRENLFAGNDMTTLVNRWQTDENKPIKMGALKVFDRFDYSFFRLNRAFAEGLHVGSRLLLERTFEAVVDAGYNPEQLKGRNIAVISGICDSSFNQNVDIATQTFETALGKSKFMTPNRISYWLDVHGPSFALDTSSSSSLYALDHAFKLIKKGACEGAIVCVSNLCLQPASDLYETEMLSPEGTCRPFDADGNGFTRAEAIVVVFVQKKKDARRVYANIVHSKTNSDGFKPEGISFPVVKLQKELYEQFYREINIDPASVSYLEAYATGVPVEDITEGTSIEEFFCANRKTPLKIGSVNSNMGYAESASGLCSLAKMIIAFESKMIPANLNYTNPNPKIKGLQNGNLEVITEPTPLKGEYFALNSFGFGGANGHILLSPHKKIKNISDTQAEDDLPRLITISGRTEEAVDCIFEDLEKNRRDNEYIRLMHEIFSEDISGHVQRGYIILNKNKETIKSQKFISGVKRPILFVFPGMGSQWPGMGASLMKIPIFAESIEKSNEILKTKGIDLIEVLTNNDPKIFDNIMNSFVGITAIQIALIDVLRALDVKADKIIGHSVGELGCAYADECFTAEQTILSAYYRGLVSLESEFIHGTMAAVGKGYNEMKDLVPPEIVIACHNSSTSCTISGPTEKVKEFMKELQEKKTFVRAVNTSNIAYHSPYISSAAPKFIEYLRKIIPNPKLRSDKWICTSALENEWNSDEVKYSSAEYHTNNLLNSVYFEESCIHIPTDAIAIEIAPHGLLNAILKRSLPETVDNIPLTLKNHENEVEFFLNAVGQMYQAGCNPKLSNIYPAIEFPVSVSTPMISPLIKWQHEEQWLTGLSESENSILGEREVSVNPQKDNYEYLKDHIIDGRNVYPVLGYLGLVWETVAMMQKKKLETVPVIFENVRFERATHVPKKGTIRFQITIHVGTRDFEVVENGTVVASGFVRTPETVDKDMVNITFKNDLSIEDKSILNTEDFYKELRSRGYHYKGSFRKVVYANDEGTFGKISWCNNFIAFMSTMAQIMTLHTDCRQPVVPTFIRKIVIDVNKHFEALKTSDNESSVLPVNFYPNLNLLCSDGIQMCGWITKEVVRRTLITDDVLLEKHEFVPYISDQQMDFDSALRICIQIVLENIMPVKVKTYEILDEQNETKHHYISTAVAEILKDVPSVEADINVLTVSENDVKSTLQKSKLIKISSGGLPNDKSCSLIILPNNCIQNGLEFSSKLFEALGKDGFVIAKEPSRNVSWLETLGFNVCFSRAINNQERILLLNKVNKENRIFKIIRLKQNNSSHWLSQVQNSKKDIEKEKREKLIIYAEKQNGILEFFNNLRNREKESQASCFIMKDKNAPLFSLENKFYKSQFDKNLSHNVYKNGHWGSYRRLRLQLDENSNSKVSSAFCTLETCADISSLRWLEDSLNPSKFNNSTERPIVQVYYSGLNFHDIMTSVGVLSPSTFMENYRFTEGHQGIEYSGRDANGRRIMGMVRNKGIATMVEAIPDYTWAVPENMSLEEAATIPVVYSTVILAFFFKINLKKGASILIHAGSGDIGQAAINICLHYNCTIFTTVDSPEKKEFLVKNFPQIPESHICNLNSTSFEKFILKKTNGEGVDIVLNNLSGDKLQASVRCLGLVGNFLEIGKFDMVKNKPLELGHFLKDLTFHSVHLDQIICSRNGIKSRIQKKLQEMLDQGIIKPIQRTVFQSNEVKSAFRHLAVGKHSGKILIKIREEDKDFRPERYSIQIQAKPRLLCKGNAAYIIIEDSDAFSLELADRLISRGARNIVLCSQFGTENAGYKNYKIKQWRSYGINVVVSNEDITKEIGVGNVLKTANSLGGTAGIFYVVMNSEECPSAHERTQNIDCTTKAISNFDKMSLKLCKNLEYFVAFLCMPKTAENYDSGISLLENIFEFRKANNLPALAIKLEVAKDIETMIEFTDENFSTSTNNVIQQNAKSCLDTLDLLAKQSNAVVAASVITKNHHSDFDIVIEAAKIMGIENLDTVDRTKTFQDLGMNLILAEELVQILDLKFDLFFTIENLQNMTFEKLYKIQKKKFDSLNDD